MYDFTAVNLNIIMKPTVNELLGVVESPCISPNKCLDTLVTHSRLYLTNQFEIGDLVHYNSTSGIWEIAVPGNCDFMVVNIDVNHNWFEIASTGKWRIDNLDLYGEVYIGSDSKLTLTPTAQNIGWLLDGVIHLNIDKDSVEKGNTGDKGDAGDNGLSAYQLALSNGFTGLVSDWLLSLKGESGLNGLSAYQLALGEGFTGTLADWLLSLIGPKGDNGSDATYTLPVASTTVLGGIKVGANLSIDIDGFLNATAGGGGGSSIPMIAGTGEDSLVGNTDLTASRALGPASIALGINSTTGVDAHGAVSWGLQSSALAMFSIAGGMNGKVGLGSGMAVAMGNGATIGVNSSGAVSLGMYNSIKDECGASFACGQSNVINNGSNGCFASGQGNTIGTNSDYSHAEGYGNTVSNNTTMSHVEGYGNNVTGNWNHAEGKFTKATGDGAHAEGNGSGSNSIVASGDGSHAEGSVSSKATGQGSHSEGWQSVASGDYSHCEGGNGTASGRASHTEGFTNTSSGEGSHAEGQNNTVSGDGSHVEGSGNTSTNSSNHAEGFDNTVSGQGAHVEGHHNKASGTAAHCEGSFNEANNDSTHAEGMNNFANAPLTHVEGQGNIAGISHQHIHGKWALDDSSYVGTNPKISKIGWGVDGTARKDVHFVRADGTIGTAAFKTNGTGSPTGLGAKCPAVTATTPYAWLQFELSDGSIVYIPAWK